MYEDESDNPMNPRLERMVRRLRMAGRGGGHRGPFGRGGGGGFPPGPPGFPPFGGFRWGQFGRGPRVKRGDVRAGILALLTEQPRNGYQIIQELEQRSRGVWRPSPGSIYPALQQLEDEGLVRVEASGNGRVFELTDSGRAYVKAHRDELDKPWEAMSEAAGMGDTHELMSLAQQVAAAAMQVAQAGNAEQVKHARQVLTEARRSLYRTLADEDADTE